MTSLESMTTSRPDVKGAILSYETREAKEIIIHYTPAHGEYYKFDLAYQTPNYARITVGLIESETYLRVCYYDKHGRVAKMDDFPPQHTRVEVEYAV